jgi:hypothetical protein
VLPEWPASHGAADALRRLVQGTPLPQRGSTAAPTARVNFVMISSRSASLAL